MKLFKYILFITLLICGITSFALSLDNYENCRQAQNEIQDSSNTKNWNQLKIASTKVQVECTATHTPQSLTEEVSYQFGMAELMLGNLESSFQVANRCIATYYFSPRCHMLISTYFYVSKDLMKLKESLDRGLTVSNVVAKRLTTDLKNFEKLKSKNDDINLRIAEIKFDLSNTNSTIDYFNQLRKELKIK